MQPMATEKTSNYAGSRYLRILSESAEGMQQDTA
jgi:hypothetical protein